MRRSHFAMLAAAAAMGTVALPPPSALVPERPDRTQDQEKMSRQRKRWLERQARKQMRKHKTTRR